MVTVQIKRLTDDATIPTRGSYEAAGYDLYANAFVFVPCGHTVLVQTGIAVAIPEGWEGQVRSRSGCAKIGMVVANSPGTIDSDYRGEVGILIHNQSNHSALNIKKGERIAQLVFNEVPTINLEEVSDLSETERGAGGFGSTGKA